MLEVFGAIGVIAVIVVLWGWWCKNPPYNR